MTSAPIRVLAVLPGIGFGALPVAVAAGQDGSTAYPRSMLRPSQVDGTLPFLLLVGSVGTLLLLLWRAWRLRGRSSPGLPEEPIIPSASPQGQIHDRQYLSRLLQDEEQQDR